MILMLLVVILINRTNSIIQRSLMHTHAPSHTHTQTNTHPHIHTQTNIHSNTYIHSHTPAPHLMRACWAFDWKMVSLDAMAMKEGDWWAC